MIFAFGDCEVDDELYELRVRGTLIGIQPKAFDVLLYLLRHRDRVVLKEELLERVWHGVHVTDNALSQAIAGGRAGLGMEEAILTVRGRGYRFAIDVEERTGPRRAPNTDPHGLKDPLLARIQRSLAGHRGGLVIDMLEEEELSRALALLEDTTVVRVAERDPDGGLGAWRCILAHPRLRADQIAHGGVNLGLADQILHLVERASEKAPLAIVLDRIDHADLASLLLFTHVAREPRANVALIGTADLDAARSGGEISRLLWTLAEGPSSTRRVSGEHASWRLGDGAASIGKRTSAT
jgi:DNA-binding winged helix-turn-helix (wHTH) protein